MKFSDKTGQELGAIVRSGGDAQNFINSEFYTQRLKPQLDKESDAAKRNGDWYPGKSTDCAAIAITNAFNSGLREGLRGIEATILELIKQGQESDKEIQYRAEKAKKESK